MQLSTNQCYQQAEIKGLLRSCPLCHASDELSVWSSMTGAHLWCGKEGITCTRCQLDLSFVFDTNQDNEIIDRYRLDYCKIGNMEFKNTNAQLILYLDNAYLKNITNNILDLDKYRAMLMLS